MRRPLEVVTGAASRLAVVISYPGTCANTSSGPVTSRLCTPSNNTISTVRMHLSLALRGDDSNDKYPTFPAIGGRHMESGS